MSRQALTSLTNAIGPEVIELYGRRNWQMLARLYDTSERFIFALVPIVNLGTFVATPVLLTIWVHKPELFNWRICLLMALISAVIGIKEHKYQFQTSANQHSGMAKFLVISYILMICISIPAMSKFGLIGFLWAWLIVESIQLSYILYLNRLLFERQVTLTLFPLYKLAALLLSASLAAAGFFLLQFHPQTYWAALFAALSIAGLAVSSYFLFGVDDLRVAFLARILRNS
jgi:hypothetical protein